MPEFVYGAATVFVADPRVPGQTMQIEENIAYSIDEAIVVARPDLFVDIPPRLRDSMPVVEATTANPGERRARNGK